MHGKFTTHRYEIFFVKDRVYKGEMKVEYCPTEDMLADFFTKLLQGQIYRKFRDLIIGYTNIPKSFIDISKMKEHVENQGKNEE